MKNVFKIVALALVSLASFTACNKNDDYEKLVEQEKQNQIRMKEQLALQKPILAEYAEKNFVNAKLDTNYGIWYEVLAEGDSESYKYAYSTTSGVTAPYVKVSYKGQLLNGTVFDSTAEGVSRVFQINSLITAWQLAFIPKKIGEAVIGGLTENGLKKGSKIRFVTPSIYAYDNAVKTDIPANSPLVFTIEVVDISNTQLNITQ